MPRFELVGGKSSKFWEIEKAKGAKSFTARWGRIGSAGQRKSQKFTTTYACSNAYDKLVQEKLREGYQLASGSPPRPTPARSNPELEAALAEAIDDPARWLVYADWLQQVGDPRGEIIALSAAKKRPRAKRLAATHAEALWGEAKYLVDDPDPFAKVTWQPSWSRAKPEPLRVAFVHTLGPFGMVDGISVTGLDEEGHVAAAIARLVAAPIGRFVRTLHLEATLEERYSGSSGQPNYEAVIAALARAKPIALRSLSMSPGGYQLSWTATGNLAPLWKAAPHLETIAIEMGRIELGKQLDLPELVSLRLETGGLPRANLVAIGKARWPALEELVLYLGRKEYGGDARRADIAALLAEPAHFPALKRLALCNAEIQGQVVAEIATSPLLAQLDALDLSKGTLVDEEVAPILDNIAAFRKLDRLDLSDNYLTTAMEKQLRKQLGKVFVGGGSRHDEMASEREQYADAAWAKNATFRYTSIGE